MKLRIILYYLTVAILSSCHSSSREEETEVEITTQTPVTIVNVSTSTMEDAVELNATSSYMDKSIIKASINGYIQYENIKKGQFVKAGQTLYTLITKEARVIGNTINKLDPTFKFSGISSIRAAKSGIISEVSHQKGDFVQEGEQLAVISNSNSFVFLLDLPYELKRSLGNQGSVRVTLPDGENLIGYISSSLPDVDSISQTQRIIIKVNASHAIPENLIAKVRIVKTRSNNSFSLPKAAVLANETQDEFWVMKLINDTTAVRVDVETGMETEDMVEIVRPAFSLNDRLLLTGNYGLEDTAKVKIVNPK